MGTFASNGSKIYLGTTVAADTPAEFAADTWIEIKDTENLGEFGDEAAIISYRTLDQGRVRKMKGSVDGGTLELVVAADFLDAEQTPLRAHGISARRRHL